MASGTNSYGGGPAPDPFATPVPPTGKPEPPGTPEQEKPTKPAESAKTSAVSRILADKQAEKKTLGADSSGAGRALSDKTVTPKKAKDVSPTITPIKSTSKEPIVPSGSVVITAAQATKGTAKPDVKQIMVSIKEDAAAISKVARQINKTRDDAGYRMLGTLGRSLFTPEELLYHPETFANSWESFLVARNRFEQMKTNIQILRKIPNAGQKLLKDAINQHDQALGELNEALGNLISNSIKMYDERLKKMATANPKNLEVIEASLNLIMDHCEAMFCFGPKGGRLSEAWNKYTDLRKNLDTYLTPPEMDKGLIQTKKNDFLKKRMQAPLARLITPAQRASFETMLKNIEAMNKDIAANEKNIKGFAVDDKSAHLHDQMELITMELLKPENKSKKAGDPKIEELHLKLNIIHTKLGIIQSYSSLPTYQARQGDEPFEVIAKKNKKLIKQLQNIKNTLDTLQKQIDALPPGSKKEDALELQQWHKEFSEKVMEVFPTADFDVLLAGLSKAEKSYQEAGLDKQAANTRKEIEVAQKNYQDLLQFQKLLLGE
jgi:hypothetical protein